MDGKSKDIKEGKLEQLKELFPEAFTEGKIDWEKLKCTLGEDINFSNERYVLNWAGKSDAFRALQSPTTATLVPARGESVNFDDTNHVFIEGENLEVLKVLQKAYYGKVKCIIIDPPYNTGNDSFIYPDKFSEKKEDYLKRIGDKDEEGFLMKEGLFRKNSRDSGHYHSNWLSMIYPRLFLARNLLRDDGVIFVHIDDNEVHNLRMVMSEIFGEENFVAVFPWKKRTTKSDVPFGVSQDYEWVLCFTKGNFSAGIPHERKYYQTDDYPEDRWRLADLTKQTTAKERPNSAFELVDPKTGKSYPFNPNRVWGITKDTFPEYYKKGKIVFPDDYNFLNTTIPAFRVFESEDKAKAVKKFGSEEAKKSASTYLPKEVGMNEDGNKEILELFDSKVFSFPKPTTLIQHFLTTINDKDFIVLDFFGGSATTAQAVLELNKEDGGNRKFILVQMPEQCDENSETFKAGYKSIADIGKERIRRVIKKIQENPSGSHSSENGNPGELFKTEELDSRRSLSRMRGGNDETLDLGFQVYKLRPSNFKIWRGRGLESGEALTEQLDAFVDPVKPGALEENMLYELLLKSGRDLNSKVEKKKFGEVGYWVIADGELVIALSAVTDALIKDIISIKPRKVICLDRLFADNDQLKTNTVLQMKDAEVEFKTV